MDRTSNRQNAQRSLGKRVAPMLALVAPAALAGAALATYEVAAAAPQQDGAAQIAKAEAALKNGQASKAIPHAEAAVAADPLNAQYRALLGAAYMGAGRFMAAATSFEDALDLGNDDARTVLSYALAKIAVGDSRVAIATLDDARDRLSAADYGLALALAGDAQRGVQMLIHAVRFEEEVTPKLRQNLAYAYALSGNWRAARVMAAEDVPAGQIDDRMVEWAATAGADQTQQRVASLLKVKPSYDIGQPAHLALANFRSNAAFAAAEPGVSGQPEAPRQSEALAFGMADTAPAPQPIERIDPTPSQAPVAAPAARSNAVRFVSNPVVQALPRAGSRPAPAPQRRMAATTVASAEPAPRAAASETSQDSHLVQLGSYSSRVEAERGWAVLKSRFPQLAAHDVVITEAVVNGRTFFRVAAAGFGAQSAKSLCGTVKSAGRGCFTYAASSPPAGAVDKGVRLAARAR